jgi:hypothetical protein
MIAKTILEIMKIQHHENTNIISGLPKGNKVVLATIVLVTLGLLASMKPITDSLVLPEHFIPCAFTSTLIFVGAQ